MTTTTTDHQAASLSFNGSNNTTGVPVLMDIHKDYQGAMLFTVAVVCVYGLSIVAFIASHLRKRHVNKDDEIQISSYLKRLHLEEHTKLDQQFHVIRLKSQMLAASAMGQRHNRRESLVPRSPGQTPHGAWPEDGRDQGEIHIFPGRARYVPRANGSRRRGALGGGGSCDDDDDSSDDQVGLHPSIYGVGDVSPSKFGRRDYRWKRPRELPLVPQETTHNVDAAVGKNSTGETSPWSGRYRERRRAVVVLNISDDDGDDESDNYISDDNGTQFLTVSHQQRRLSGIVEDDNDDDDNNNDDNDNDDNNKDDNDNDDNDNDEFLQSHNSRSGLLANHHTGSPPTFSSQTSDESELQLLVPK